MLCKASLYIKSIFNSRSAKLTNKQRLCELHGDVGLAWKLVYGRRMEIHFETCHFHIDFSLHVVPFVIVERFWRAQGHISYPITHHENENHLGCGCERGRGNEGETLFPMCQRHAIMFQCNRTLTVKFYSDEIAEVVV